MSMSRGRTNHCSLSKGLHYILLASTCKYSSKLAATCADIKLCIQFLTLRKLAHARARVTVVGLCVCVCVSVRNKSESTKTESNQVLYVRDDYKV